MPRVLLACLLVLLPLVGLSAQKPVWKCDETGITLTFPDGWTVKPEATPGSVATAPTKSALCLVGARSGEDRGGFVQLFLGAGVYGMPIREWMDVANQQEEQKGDLAGEPWKYRRFGRVETMYRDADPGNFDPQQVLFRDYIFDKDGALLRLFIAAPPKKHDALARAIFRGLKLDPKVSIDPRWGPIPPPVLRRFDAELAEGRLTHAAARLELREGDGWYFLRQPAAPMSEAAMSVMLVRYAGGPFNLMLTVFPHDYDTGAQARMDAITAKFHGDSKPVVTRPALGRELEFRNEAGGDQLAAQFMSGDCRVRLAIGGGDADERVAVLKDALELLRVLDDREVEEARRRFYRSATNLEGHHEFADANGRQVVCPSLGLIWTQPPGSDWQLRSCDRHGPTFVSPSQNTGMRVRVVEVDPDTTLAKAAATGYGLETAGRLKAGDVVEKSIGDVPFWFATNTAPGKNPSRVFARRLDEKRCLVGMVNSLETMCDEIVRRAEDFAAAFEVVPGLAAVEATKEGTRIRRFGIHLRHAPGKIAPLIAGALGGHPRIVAGEWSLETPQGAVVVRALGVNPENMPVDAITLENSLTGMGWTGGESRPMQLGGFPARAAALGEGESRHEGFVVRRGSTLFQVEGPPGMKIAELEVMIEFEGR
ncbi:MAG: hypothetical protein R3F20_15070 [Planctomycetota bacterium]